MRSRSPYLRYLIEHHEHDRVLTVITTVYFTSVLIMLFLAGITIWPVIVFSTASDFVFSPLCQSLLTCNLILLTAYVVCDVVLLWFDRGFSFLKTALINLVTGGFVNLVLLLSQSGSFQNGVNVDFMLTLLWIIFSFFLAWILALIPAILVAAGAKLVHSLFFLFHH